MKRLIRQIIANLLIVLGFVRRKNNQIHSSNLITSIYFHDPSKELFERCINWLIKNKYHFISTEDLYNTLVNNKKIDAGAVCITVDDGKKNNLENIIPLATKLKIPITLFISTEPVENGVFWWSYINKNNTKRVNKISVEFCKRLPNSERLKLIEQIKMSVNLKREAMAKEDVINISKLNNVTIGNHTVNHPITTMCEIKDLNYEISEASNLLKSWVGDEISFFAYPNGDFDGREVDVLINNKIKMAFTTIPKHIDPHQQINPFQVPRFSLNDEGSVAENICKMVGVWQKYIH